jgi:predicted GNAT superfamily acetyltransferase
MSSTPPGSLLPGVTIRPLSGASEFEAAVDLQKSVWDFADRDLVPLSELVAADHNDGIVLGAFVDERLVAFLFSFVGRRAGNYLQYSRMLAVHPDRQGLGLGAVMKQEQKRIALEKGYTRMEWTFDPLEVRNGSLNLRKLGARVRTYFRDLYGQRSSRFDLGVPTDRFLAEWDLAEDLNVTGKARRRAIESAVAAFEVERRGDMDWPGKFRGLPEMGALTIPVPSRFQTIRESSNEAALAWRLAVREAAEAAFAGGFVAVDCVARLAGVEGLGAHVLVRELKD